MFLKLIATFLGVISRISAQFQPVNDFNDYNNNFGGFDQQDGFGINEGSQDINTQSFNFPYDNGNTNQLLGACPPTFGNRIPDFSKINWNNIDRRCEEKWFHLYPFGERFYDINIAYRLWHDTQIDLDFFLPFYGFRFNYTFIFPEGFIAFSYPRYVQPPYTFPEPKWPNKQDPSMIATFLAPQSFMFVGDTELSHVWYRIVSRPISMIDNRNDPAFGNNQRSQPLYRMPNGQPSAQTYGNNRYFLKIQDGRIEDPVMLDIITRDVHESMVGTRGFIADYALIVTWERMGYGGAPKVVRLDLYNEVKKWQNTYQMVVATDEIRTYVMHNYANVNWTSSTAAGALFGRGGAQSAVVGYNGGNGTGFYEMPYSAEGNTYKLVQYGATEVAGRWLARIDEAIIYGGCTNNSLGLLARHTPYMAMLGGFALNVSGPCLRPNYVLKMQMDIITVDCIRINMVKARCIVPVAAEWRFGPTTIQLSVDGGKQYNFKNNFYIMPPNFDRESVKLIDDPLESSNNWNDPSAGNLTLRYSAANITVDPNAMVDIILYGYHENLRVQTFTEVGSIARSIPNKGVYSFDPRMLTRETNKNEYPDGWKMFDFGVIQVRKSVDWQADYGDGIYWSRMVPFGWFWRQEYEYYYGANWALDKCIEWFDNEGRLYNFWPFVEEQASCPCTLEQANTDRGLFMTMPDCDMFGNAACAYASAASHCVVSAFGLYNGAAQMCCYDPDGWLMFSQDYEYDSNYISIYGAGVPQRAHPYGTYPYLRPPYIPGFSNFFWDRQPMTLCCNWAGHCEFYYWRRESSGCQNYRGPVTGMAYGDAHFITYDGTKYTFNGKGYYVLSTLQAPDKNLMVQVRLEQPPKTIWNADVMASVITGVAAQDNSSATIQIYARREFRRWRYKMDIYTWGRRVFTDMPFKKLQIGGGITLWSPNNNLNTSIIWVYFSTGVGLRVAEDNGVLNVVMVLPSSYNETSKYARHQYAPGGGELQIFEGGGDQGGGSYFTGYQKLACTDTYKTLGLLGAWNGYPDDDLITDDCKEFKLPRDPDRNDMRNLYYDFGETYRADGKKYGILFDTKHKPLYDPLSFADKQNYQPVFDPERRPLGNASLILSKNQIYATCGGSQSCIYDYFMTGRREIAVDTMKNERLFLAMKASDSLRLVSCGPLQKNEGVIKFPPGNTYLDGVTVTFACQPEYFRHGEETRYCVNGTWSPGWWAWCRSRSVEEGLKWFTGIIVSLLIALFLAAIFLWCYCTNVRGRKHVARHYTANVSDHDHSHARTFAKPVVNTVPVPPPHREKKGSGPTFSVPVMEAEPPGGGRYGSKEALSGLENGVSRETKA